VLLSKSTLKEFIIREIITGMVLNKLLLPYDKFLVKQDELDFERILRRRFPHLSTFSYYWTASGVPTFEMV
jgi:hypothetical protein